MEEIIVDKIDDFKSFVEQMKVNTYYKLPKNYRYEWIKIEKSTKHYSNEVYYCWAMANNYSVSKCVGYVYPYGGSNKVPHFKTEAGAKRNLIKRFSHHFTRKELTETI